MSDLTIGEARKKWHKAFQQFWAAYPKHVAPTEAERMFADLVEFKGADPHHLIAAAKRFATECGEDLKYVPAPHSWLKQGRYDDADLFMDETQAQITWLQQCWRTHDVHAVENRYHISMPKTYPPDEIFNEPAPGVTVEEALDLWWKTQAREWITIVAKDKGAKLKEASA